MRARGTVAPRGSGTIATRPSPGAVVSNLHPQSNTSKAQGIREDMDRLNEDYFGATPSNPTVTSGVGGMVSTPERLFKTPKSVGDLRGSWLQGPVDPAGKEFDASGRNLLCMAVQGQNAVVGSADHGLAVFDLARGRKLRSLFSKTCGHTEWVTSCAYLRDGRILSGAMDKKMCLWSASAVRCDDLTGHSGSISQVAVNDTNIAVSASYDRTLRVWDLDRHSTVGTLAGHSGPVMQFVWAEDLLYSGDRKGEVICWDMVSGSPVAKLKTKGGQVGSLGALHDGEHRLLLAGDQSGTLSVWDLRVGTTPVFQHTLHPGGVVSSALATSMPSDNLVVTAGADKRIMTLDPRGGFQPIHTFTDHKDFIYSVETHGPLILSGGGNGWVLAHDTESGKCLYGLGAGENAIRCMHAEDNMLACAGDDGKLLVYRF